MPHLVSQLPPVVATEPLDEDEPSVDDVPAEPDFVEVSDDGALLDVDAGFWDDDWELDVPLLVAVEAPHAASVIVSAPVPSTAAAVVFMVAERTRR